MTTNERLFVLGLMEKWDLAIRDRDRAQMVQLLEVAEIPDPAKIVDTVLAYPERYGFFEDADGRLNRRPTRL